MEVCAGFELIAIENTTTRGDDLLEIGKGREAQMIRHMRHGSSPRLMALQPIRVPDPGEPLTGPISRSPYETSTSPWHSLETISSGLCLFLDIGPSSFGLEATLQGGPPQRLPG